MYSEDKDEDKKVAFFVIWGVVAAAVLGVLGLVLGTGMGAGKDTSAAKKTDAAVVAPAANAAGAASAATTGATAAVIDISKLKDTDAAVITENGVVKFYFASGKADLAEHGKEALADVVKGVQAGQKAVISGFHDQTGNAAANAELAKKRAMLVRDTLIGLGVAQDKIELKKPEETQGTGTNAQARRVEVVLVK